MYFFSGSEVWRNVIPVFAVTSSNCGIARPAHATAFAPGGGAEGVGWPSCPNANAAAKNHNSIAFQLLQTIRRLNVRPSILLRWNIGCTRTAEFASTQKRAGYFECSMNLSSILALGKRITPSRASRYSASIRSTQKTVYKCSKALGGKTRGGSRCGRQSNPASAARLPLQRWP